MIYAIAPYRRWSRRLTQQANRRPTRAGASPPAGVRLSDGLGGMEGSNDAVQSPTNQRTNYSVHQRSADAEHENVSRLR